MQTLDDFLTSPVRSWPRNAYVKAPGFRSLYVRRTRRLINGVWVDGVLDLANAEATHPGGGAFTALVCDLINRGIPLYAECVHNRRLVAKLERMGFTRMLGNDYAPSFFRLPE